MCLIRTVQLAWHAPCAAVIVGAASMAPSPTFAGVLATDNTFQSRHLDDETRAAPPFTADAYTSPAIRQAVAAGVECINCCW